METYATRRETLKDWQDFDVAMLHVARALGIMGPEVQCVINAKPVLWSKNDCNDLLADILDTLTKGGALEFGAEESRDRWNPLFSWEEKGQWWQNPK